MGLIMIVSSMHYGITKLAHHEGSVHEVNAFNLQPAFAFLSVATTAIEGVLTVLPCRSSMKKKEVIFKLNRFIRI
jgi:hypothetical protein